MPDNLKTQMNGLSTSFNGSTDELQESMWHLKIQNQDGEITANSTHYPDRPGEPDCIYYLRTGLCGYGSNCRFNHPVYAGQVTQYNGELPERAGQPDCQYYLKTGTCKFGPTCKFHHPRDRHIAEQVPLNILGLPMRQEEKSCLFYMRTWSCKFGAACKFHHPQPVGLGSILPVSGPPPYGSTGSSVAPLSDLSYVGGLPTWSSPRAPSMPGLSMQASQAYMPLVLSPSQGIIPAQQRWTTYVGESGSTGQVGLSASVSHYPERPEQPECQYYLKTGSCKFGPECKYHHPKERIAPLASTNLGPYGLPLRPGQAICTLYSMYGICKFGSACKFDHPLTGYYNYGASVPTLSLLDSSPFAYQRDSPTSRSSETSPSKSLKLSDRTKIEMTSTKHQNSDTKATEDIPQEATSPTHATPTSSEHPHNQSG